MLHVALHGTLMHFYPGELLFSYTLCCWPHSEMEVCNVAITLACEVYVYIHIYHTHTHTPTNMQACTCACAHIHTHTHTQPNGNIYEYIPCAFKCIYTRHFFTSFFFSAPCQFTPLLKLCSHFCFNIIWLALFYYAKPIFLMGISSCICTFFIYTHLFRNTTTSIKMDWVWSISHSAIFWPRKVFAMTCGVTHILGFFLWELQIRHT